MWLTLWAFLPVAAAQDASALQSAKEGTQLALAARAAQQMPSSDQTGQLRVLAGKSLLLNSQEPLKRVSVTDPAVASALIVNPRQVLIHGLSVGRVSLILWDEQERVQAYDLNVAVDLSEIRDVLRRSLAGENIDVNQSGSTLTLVGTASSAKVAERALALAKAQSKEAVSMLVVGEQKQQVLLQVRFAEVDRTAIQQLGVNLLSTGAANTLGVVSTQHFGSPVLGNVGAVPDSVGRGRDPESPSLIAGGVGNALEGSPSVFGLSDLLNIFIFRPDLNLGATVRALSQNNVLQILAEPNLLTSDGSEANFLAGGEFPFPVLQGVTGAVVIQFKEFGVRLKFTPEILDGQMIRLKVAPEVSSLDFANALTVSGFLVPALSTRRAETAVQLADGQSFAIAGLIDNRMTEVASKVPGLGDIPFLGKLFRSRGISRNNTELLVMVTPRLVKPLDAGMVPSGPNFPKSFLDKEKFDGKVGEASSPARQ